jgi:hypothetical protein
MVVVQVHILQGVYMTNVDKVKHHLATFTGGQVTVTHDYTVEDAVVWHFSVDCGQRAGAIGGWAGGYTVITLTEGSLKTIGDRYSWLPIGVLYTLWM